MRRARKNGRRDIQFGARMPRADLSGPPRPYLLDIEWYRDCRVSPSDAE